MAIKTQEYIDFSGNLHTREIYEPLTAQIELTYRCPLHCSHCYTDCYNNRAYVSKELSTNQVKKIMDKCKSGGVLWLCFTGGDPMMRKDFVELYFYAKKLGFITSVFSPLVLMNKKTLEIFKSSPPFNIETTLNAATCKKYKEITGTSLFKKHIHNIKKLLKSGVLTRVKTEVTKQNISQIDKIKKLVESLGLAFRPGTMLHPRLNGDTYPCALRLDPKKAAFVNEQYGYSGTRELKRSKGKIDVGKAIQKPRNKNLFSCRIGYHSFWITPQGMMAICGMLRTFNYNLLQKNHTVKAGFYRLSKKIRSVTFYPASKCGSCKYRLLCKWCPGRAFLEKGSLEEPIDYFCNLTKEVIKLKNITIKSCLRKRHFF